MKTPPKVPDALSAVATLVVEVAEQAKAAIASGIGALAAKLLSGSKGAASKAGSASARTAKPSTAQAPSESPAPDAATAVKGTVPNLSSMSTSEAVAAALGKLAGPVSASAVQTELRQLGRDEPIGHIETALSALVAQKKVIKHGPAMWEAVKTA